MSEKIGGQTIPDDPPGHVSTEVEGSDEQAQLEGTSLPHELPAETVNGRGFEEFRAVGEVVAAKLIRPVQINGGNGDGATGERGDYLCVDNDGHLYTVKQHIFVQRYAPLNPL